MEAPKVRVGVGAFILKSSKESATNPRFLVGLRKGSHGAGTYSLPGGHIEFGETLEQTTAREIDEETGLKIVNPRYLTATNDFMPKDNKHYVTVFMVCEREDESIEPQNLEPDKCERWEWVSWEELMQWINVAESAKEGEKIERNIFIPLLNLKKQRSGILPKNL